MCIAETKLNWKAERAKIKRKCKIKDNTRPKFKSLGSNKTNWKKIIRIRHNHNSHYVSWTFVRKSTFKNTQARDNGNLNLVHYNYSYIYSSCETFIIENLVMLQIFYGYFFSLILNGSLLKTLSVLSWNVWFSFDLSIKLLSLFLRSLINFFLIQI